MARSWPDTACNHNPIELASLGARPYNYRYMDLHDIAFVFHGCMSMILFGTISLQGRREGVSGTDGPRLRACMIV